MKDEFWNETSIKELILEYWSFLKAKEYTIKYTAKCLFIFIDLLADQEVK